MPAPAMVLRHCVGPGVGVGPIELAEAETDGQMVGEELADLGPELLGLDRVAHVHRPAS